MAGLGLAAAQSGYQAAKDLGLLEEIRTFTSNVVRPEKKRAAAKMKAGEVFTLASSYIGNCPDKQGFGEFAQWWLGLVLELLVKWDRLDKNLAGKWISLGTDIIRLKGAKWYKIELGAAEEFKGESKINGNRYQIGRKSADVRLQAELLLGFYGTHLEGKGYEPAQGCCEFPAMEHMKAFISFHSRAETMGRIRHSIDTHPSSFTQIYGAAGIGKTAILVEIAKQLGHEFQRVVYVAVSRSPKTFEIQKDMARQLGVPLEDTNKHLAVRAEEVKRLIINNSEKVLLLLDDVWGDVNLNEIGIPTGKMVKVLIATRLSNLPLQDHDDKIPVGLLNDEESWRFFEEAAGLVGTETLKVTAKKVAEECCGLPLALAVIGRTLSGSRDELTWRNALGHLRRSEIKDLKAGVDMGNVQDLLCKVIGYSYQHLDRRTWHKQDAGTGSVSNLPTNDPDTMAEEDGIARDIFRLCCLFPENHDIPREDLKKYLIAGNAGLKSEEFDSAILRLSNCHLLQSTHGKGVVKMQGVVRDVAVDITEKDDSAFIICGTANIETELSEETVTSNKTVSVMGSNINTAVGFPENTWLNLLKGSFAGGQAAKVAKVKTLLLRGNTGLKKLPPSFFQRMGDLTVLDLSESAIKSLPSTMNRLTNVRTLVLNGCKDLTQVDVIEELRGLVVLCLRESALTSLPRAMSNLLDLAVLEFSPAAKCDIRKGFFIALPQLKELSLASKFVSVDTFMEIIALRNMKALRLCVYSNVLSSAEFEKKFENGQPLHEWKEFTMFFAKEDVQAVTGVSAPATAPASATTLAASPVSATVTISSDFTYHPMSLTKKLHIQDLDRAKDGVKLLLQAAEHLIIENCFPPMPPLMQVKDLGAATGVSTFSQTKILHLKDCTKIQYLGSSGWENLEVLELTGLEEFEGIFEGTVSDDSFKVVREITFRRCNNMISSVMPGNVLQMLHGTLQKITVIKCVEVKYIFHTNGGNPDLLPFLVFIDLRGLVELKAIWEGIPPQGTFAKLKELMVIDCDTIDCVFTPSLAAMLKSLQKLTVKNNKGLKAIVKWNGGPPLDTKIFERITHLWIQDLVLLEHFYGSTTKEYLKLPSLIQLRLGGCDKLTRFPIGKGSAPYMTLLHVTSETDKLSPWYNELKELEKDNLVGKKEDITSPHFKICVPCPSI